MHRPQWLSPVCAVAVVLTLLVAGCTSSAGTPKATEAPHASSGVTGSSGTTTKGTTTPTIAPVSRPAASPSPRPQSKFEKDPAVAALRAWAVEVAHAVTAGHNTSAKLDALMTPAFAKSIKGIDGGELGHYYPGPLPFTPIGVRNITSSSRDVRLCLLAGGYSQHPATRKLWTKHSVVAVTAAASLVDGGWRVSKFAGATFACSGVPIATPSW